MKAKTTTAGKTAKKDTRRTWRTVTTNGETRLISPDGMRYSGTAQEVRDAGLVPWRRSALAESLQLARHLRREGTLDAGGFRAMCEDRRRGAIRYGAADAKNPHSVDISAATLIMLEAGSRLVRGEGETFADYLADLFDAEITALLDVAESEGGKREIPLTRHERAALERLHGTPRT